MKNVRFNARLAALPLALLPALPALAQNSLKETVVSASLTEQRVQDALPSTTLITRADIERAQTPDLPTLLRRVTGLQITQSGGAGTVSSAFIRGAESRHTLVLVDGVPVNNLNFSLAAIEHMPLANVERIEVVRGNVSSLYGSAALGGVIQIFTRQAGAQPEASVTAQVGSRGMHQLSATAAARVGTGTQISASLETLGQGGFNAINQAKRAGTNPDNDGYRRKSSTVSLVQTLEAGHTLGLRLRETSGTIQYDNQFGPATQADESSYRQSGGVLDGKFKLGRDVVLDVALTDSTDKLNAAITAFPYFVNSYSQGTRLGLVWQLAPGQKITSGAETTRQRIESDTVYNKASRRQDSVRLGYQGDFERHQVQLNLRNDHYTDFGSATTFLAGYAYRLNDAWRLNASRSNGFNAPTFNDLYYPFGGNANLRPERVQSSELGLQYVGQGRELRVVLFDNRFTDLIANDAAFNRVNVDRARNRGMELSYAGTYGDLGVRGGLTLQNPVDQTTNQRLSRRAAGLANLGLTRDVGAWSLGADARYSGQRPDGVQQLGHYTVLDVSASYRLNARVKLFGRVENLFNRKYETVYGYNQAGATVFAGVRWQL